MSASKNLNLVESKKKKIIKKKKMILAPELFFKVYLSLSLLTML